MREVTSSQRLTSSALTTIMLGLAMVFSIAIMCEQVSSDSAHCELWSWIRVGALSLRVGYLVDPLSSIMVVLVTTVGVMVMVYTYGYMCHDQGYVRFFAYLSLFTASMLALALSPNLVQVYVFWELVGMCSYLLIGFWFTRASASYASQKAFVLNRVGDFGLLLGILGLYSLTGSVDFTTVGEAMHAVLVEDPRQGTFANVCCILLFVGPIAKSAQFPLHVWLPDAMEGPTPISALIHAATMVAAGVFLTARLLPLFQQFPIVMDSVAWIGGLTAFLGATIALAQTDLKKGLAYSTMSQLGYMMLALGIGSYQAGLFHLVTHAYSKALLFLCAGSVIHGMESVVGYSPSKNQDLNHMGGIRTYMPITSMAFLLGTLSLCGIPPLSCFWSKDQILADAWQRLPVLGWIAWVTAGLTAFYMFRMYLVTFEGTLRGATMDQHHSAFMLEQNKLNHSVHGTHVHENHSLHQGDVYPSESDATMIAPLLLLTIPTTFLGLIGAPSSSGFANSDLFSVWLHIQPLASDPLLKQNWIEFAITAFPSVSIALIGILFAWLLYGPHTYKSRSTTKSIDPIGTGRGGWLINSVYHWSLNRAYIDQLYNNTFVSLTRSVANLLCALDQWIMDGAVNLSGLLTLLSGESARYGEGGRATSYLFVLITGFISLLSVSMLSAVSHW